MKLFLGHATELLMPELHFFSDYDNDNDNDTLCIPCATYC